MIKRIALLSWALMFVPAAAAAADPAELFGAREGVADISLSPDGTKVAYIAPTRGQGNALYTVALASGEPKVATAADGKPLRLSDCNWVSDERLVCTFYAIWKSGAGELAAGSRLVAVNADGSAVKLLSQLPGQDALASTEFGGNVVDWLPDEDGSILMGRIFVPEARLGTLIEKRGNGYGVERIDTGTLKKSSVESGATFVTDKRATMYFDQDVQGLVTSLGKALPGLRTYVMDSSRDGTKMLVWSGSDVDPGNYYVFDRSAKRLNKILLAREQLAGTKLATVKPVRVRGGDGTMIPGYLTLPPGSGGKNLPAIVLPHGGPEARDEWGFDWLAQYFANRGYAVLQPNFRGSTGYGDSWFQNNGFRSWRTAVGDVVDAGKWLVSEGIADPSKLAIVGWSYGGYAALQSNVLDPDLYKAVVAIAPVTDFKTTVEESRGWTNFRLEQERVGSGAHTREGSPAQNAARFKAPVLLFHGEHDRHVGIRQSQMMADRLRDAGKRQELVVYPGLDHQLDDSQARADMLRRTDQFLRNSMGL